jgi:dipeptidyl aminopeptidase/acylaminoacyl peptidase
MYYRLLAKDMSFLKFTIKHLPFVLLITLSACFAGTSTPNATGNPSSSSLPESSDLEVPSMPVASSAEMANIPLSIDYLRSRTYKGSDFVFEQTLDPGSNYNRYIVSYRSDGLKIYALMTIPWEQKPETGYPVIIFNHGYIPPEQYRTTERYVAYVDAFARNGYIVVKSDYRGYGSSEGKSTSIYGDPGYVIDVLNALASARRYPDADPNRIGMWGHSMGGYITLRAMVANQGIKAGVIWSGVVASYAEMFNSWFGGDRGSTRPSWRSAMIAANGTSAQNPAFWNALSANAYLSDLSGPIQLHHGTGDTTVPYNYSVMLDQEIKAAGGSSELFLYPNDDHNIATNRDNALVLSVVFFNQHVKNIQG